MANNDTMPKHLRPLWKVLRKQGWEIGQTRNGHWFFRRSATATAPQYTVICGGSPSDVRATANMKAELRRAGAKV